MSPYITFELIIAVAGCVFVLGIIIFARLFDSFERWRTWISLRRSNRIITLKEAVKKSQANFGVILRNESSLPGQFWFVPTDGKCDPAFLWEDANVKGMIITASKVELEQHHAMLGSVDSLVEPFCILRD